MNYSGQLYGRIGRKFIPLEMTSGDVDDLEAKKQKLETLINGLLNDTREYICRIKDCKYEPDKVLIFCETMTRVLGMAEAIKKEDV